MARVANGRRRYHIHHFCGASRRRPKTPEGRRKDELARGIEEAVAPYRESRALLAFDADAAEQYAEVLASREAAGVPISTADAQIAAICLAHGAACATRNVKDFHHTEVKLVDPWNVDA